MTPERMKLNRKVAEGKAMTATAQNQQNAIHHWYEDPNEQQVLLNLLNREGFLLEDAVYEILSRNKHEAILHRGEVFEGAPHRDISRTEIDLWIKSGNFIFLIESKRSEYDWIFLQDQHAAKDVHLIMKWLAKTGHKIGKNKLSFTPINKKIEGKQNGTQKTQRRIQG